MRPNVSIPFAAVSMLLLSACSSNPSVSESQCIAGDWQTVGYRDGTNGLRSTQLLQHQDACVQYDVIARESCSAASRRASWAALLSSRKRMASWKERS